MNKLIAFGLVALAALTACNTNPNLLEDDGQEFEFFAQDTTALGVQAEGDIPSLRVKLGVKSRTNALGVREKLPSATFKWQAADSTMTGSVDLIIRKLNTTAALGTKTASVTSNLTLDAGAGYTGNVAFADPIVTLDSLCVDATWNLTTGATGFTFTQPNTVTFCQKAPPTAVADLKFTPSILPNIPLNDTATLQIGVQNAGKSTATNVSTVLNLPSNVQYLATASTFWNCSNVLATLPATGSVLTCTAPTFNKGTKDIPISVKGLTEGAASITGSISSITVDPISVNNSLNLTANVVLGAPPTPKSDFSVTTSVPANLAAKTGVAVPITFNIANLGPNDRVAGRSITLARSSSLTFGTAVVSGGTCTNAGDVTTCDLPALNSNQSTAITLTVTPTAIGFVGATATLAADATDPGTANNTSSISFEVTAS